MKRYNLLKVFLLCIIIFSSNCKNAIEKEGITLDIQNTDSIQNHVNSFVETYIIDKKLQSKDYIYLQGYKPKDGFVPTAEIAVKIAEIILGNIFENTNMDELKPFSVNLDNNTWIIIHTHSNPQRKGGTVYMEISEKTGEILKMSYEK